LRELQLLLDKDGEELDKELTGQSYETLLAELKKIMIKAGKKQQDF
jgi:hypothetical protein